MPSIPHPQLLLCLLISMVSGLTFTGMGRELNASDEGFGMGLSLAYDPLTDVLVAGAPDEFGGIYIYERNRPCASGTCFQNLPFFLRAPWYASLYLSWNQAAFPQFGSAISIFGGVIAATSPGMPAGTAPAISFFAKNYTSGLWESPSIFPTFTDPATLKFGNAIQLWDALGASFFVSDNASIRFYTYSFFPAAWVLQFVQESSCGEIHTISAIRTAGVQGIWVAGKNCIERWNFNGAALALAIRLDYTNYGIGMSNQDAFLEVAAADSPGFIQGLTYTIGTYPEWSPPKTVSFGPVLQPPVHTGIARFYGLNLHYFLGEPSHDTNRGRILYRNDVTGLIREATFNEITQGSRFGWNLLPTRAIVGSGCELVVAAPGYDGERGRLFIANIATIGLDEILPGAVQTLLNGTASQNATLNIVNELLTVLGLNNITDLSITNGAVQLQPNSSLNVLGNFNASNTTIYASSSSEVSVSGCADFSNAGLVVDPNTSFVVRGSCVKPFNSINLTSKPTSCQTFDPKQTVGASSLVVVATVYDDVDCNDQVPSNPAAPGSPPAPGDEETTGGGGFPIWAIVLVAVVGALMIIIVLVIFLVPSVRDAVFPYSSVPDEI